MAGEIKHSWNGTVLTVTSDSGTSSADLKGDKGDDGIRGAQGAQGVVDTSVCLTKSEAKDYVVETGTEGTWSWRKWHSGVAECWGVNIIKYNTTTKGNYAVTAENIELTFPTGLFNKSPVAQFTPMGGGYPSINIANYVGGVSITFAIRTEWAVNDLPMWLQSYAIGTWK